MNLFQMSKNKAITALCIFFATTPYLPSLMMRIPGMRLIVIEVVSLTLFVLGAIILALYSVAWQHLLSEDREPGIWFNTVALALGAFLCFLAGLTTLLGTFKFSTPYEGVQLMAPWCSLSIISLLALQIWISRNEK